MFQRLSLADRMHFTVLETPPGQDPQCLISGFPPNLPPENNLIHRAWAGLIQTFGAEAVGSVRVEVEKRIPAGGGLGGGSSNAATTLAAVCQLRGLKASAADLHPLAASLGADVPFFLSDATTALGRGTGTDLTPGPQPPVAWTLVLAIPPVGMSTAEAYGQLSHHPRPGPAHRLEDLMAALAQGDPARLADCIHNDFELILPPDQIAFARSAREAGALGTLLCGSGSTQALLFSDSLAAQNLLATKKASRSHEWVLLPATTCGPIR